MSGPALPPGARVLHIGPFKTGSTAVQWALHTARDDLARQGVRYASRTRHDALAARYAVDRLLPDDVPARGARAWRRVVDDLHASGDGRAVYSSEYFCLADDDRVERVVSDSGRGPTWVVVTIRPLAALLPSQYQQLLQGDLTLRYHPWVEAVLGAPPGEGPTPSFWRRHRHDHLVTRWARVVGTDRVVVLVLDSRDHQWTARAFEGLLGLREGTLGFDGVPTNRSLTWPEAEVLRSFNEQFAASGVSRKVYRPLVGPAVRHLKSRVPEPGEAALVTQRWAVERANAIGAEMAEALRASGVRVHGDLDQLARGALPEDGPPEPTHVRTDVAARFALGLAMAAQESVVRRRSPRQTS